MAGSAQPEAIALWLQVSINVGAIHGDEKLGVGVTQGEVAVVAQQRHEHAQHWREPPGYWTAREHAHVNQRFVDAVSVGGGRGARALTNLIVPAPTSA